MEEMQRLIGKRATENTPRRQMSFVPQEDSPSRSPEVQREDTTRAMNDFVAQLESELSAAQEFVDSFTSGLKSTLSKSFEVGIQHYSTTNLLC